MATITYREIIIQHHELLSKGINPTGILLNSKECKRLEEQAMKEMGISETKNIKFNSFQGLIIYRSNDVIKGTVKFIV